MQDNLANIAIAAALAYNWEEAIAVNKQILKEKENDVNALSRLAYAYLQVGRINEAKRIYHQILSIDHFNMIAQKNLEKINSLPKRSKIHPSRSSCSEQKKTITLSPNLFLEEPGKTKTVTLINAAPTSVLSKLSVGQTVIICPKKHSIEIRSEQKTYLGALPDDLAFRLIRLIKGGNCYHVCIKNVTKNSISVFLKEIKRGKKFSLQPSFITNLGEHQIGKKPLKHNSSLEEDITEEKASQEDLEE